MQITDKLGQYSRNLANGTEELRSVQGAQKMVSTVKELSAGSIFEGTVNYAKNGKVVLGLGNGQTITARLDGKVNIRQGDSMFFQVKSNDGTTVAIKPYTGAANTGNPTLLNALTAAQVPVTERSLMMVDAMMREHLSIGKQGILDMIKVLNNNAGVNVQTLVTMTKLGMPVTERLAAQFENYMSGKQAILQDIESVAYQMTEALADETLSPEARFSLYGKMADSLLFGEHGNNAAQGAAGQAVENLQIPAGQEAGGFRAGILNGQNLAAETLLGETAPDGTLETAKQSLPDGIFAQGRLTEDQMALLSRGESIGKIFGEEQLANLTKQLQNIPTLTGNRELFVVPAAEDVFVDTLDDPVEGDAAKHVIAEENAQKPAAEPLLNKDMTAREFLYALKHALQENEQYGFSGLRRLFAGKEFQTLLRQVAEQEWLLEPKELMEEHKVQELYEKMDRQLSQIEAAVKASGSAAEGLMQTAANVRGNIDFMNQMNQIYTYIQMPLKLANQNANGELYVYTNKKQLQDPDAELTAFLHLDLQNLGSTDVSVKLYHKKVNTNFYFSEEASYSLVEKHLPILEKHLQKKGYQCTVTASKEDKGTDTMAEFLKQGQPQAVSLHRYSFDVRT